MINEGFNEASLGEISELRKALDIGYTQPVTGTGFDALRVESLESTLKLMTFQATHMRLWNQIGKTDAFSTVEEYNRLVEYGDEAGGFVSSGVLPEEENSTYERADQKVKYLGSTRVVNHPATLVRTVPADLISQETQNGALWLMGKTNIALYTADSSLIPLEFNGLIPQVISGSGHVIDLRGAPLGKDDIENAEQLVVDNYGQLTKFYTNPKVFTDFSKLHYAQQRTTFGVGGDVGTPITGYNTLTGRINFEPDQFVKRGSVVPAAATSAKAPTAPTITLGVDAPVVSGSLFGSADAGAYKYQVTALNAYGESLPCALSAAQTVAASGSITLSIIDGGGTYGATAYRIYRTEKAGSITYYTNLTVARYKPSGYSSPTPWVDLNAYLPRCFNGLALDMSPMSLVYKQLLPMIKMPLAIIAPSIRWMQLLYGTPIVYAPKKNVVFRNIGVLS